MSVSNFDQKFQTHSHEISREGWQWANEQVIKFYWRSRLFSGFVTTGRYGKWSTDTLHSYWFVSRWHW